MSPLLRAAADLLLERVPVLPRLLQYYANKKGIITGAFRRFERVNLTFRLPKKGAASRPEDRSQSIENYTNEFPAYPLADDNTLVRYNE